MTPRASLIITRHCRDLRGTAILVADQEVLVRGDKFVVAEDTCWDTLGEVEARPVAAGQLAADSLAAGAAGALRALRARAFRARALWARAFWARTALQALAALWRAAVDLAPLEAVEARIAALEARCAA